MEYQTSPANTREQDAIWLQHQDTIKIMCTYMLQQNEETRRLKQAIAPHLSPFAANMMATHTSTVAPTSEIMDLLRARLDLIPEYLRSSSASAALAVKVFSINELAEMILRNLDFADLVSAELVSKSMHATSKTLQRDLLRDAQLGTAFSFIDVLPCPFEIYYVHPSEMFAGMYTVTIGVRDVDRFARVRVGEMVRDTSICKPSIRMWTVGGRWDRRGVSGFGGLTIGELVSMCAHKDVLEDAYISEGDYVWYLQIHLEMVIDEGDPLLKAWQLGD